MARREYVDKRDWVKYNENLVRRGELYFAFEFLDSWAKDIAQMNDGKVGCRYELPDPFIQHLMMLHIILETSYRSLDGMVRKLSTYIPAIPPIGRVLESLKRHPECHQFSDGPDVINQSFSHRGSPLHPSLVTLIYL
jgi:hypothetical protein